MGKLYEKIEEEEIICKDILLPECFPAIYIDKYDNIYCYYGILDKNRFLLDSYPYWLEKQKPIDAKKYIRGYFRLENGTISVDKEFIDEKGLFKEQTKCKKIPAILQLPSTNNNPYGVYYKKSKEIEEELTKKVFGMSYEDLSQLIYHFNNCFKLTTQTYYSRYPSITRAIQKDNYCDITEIWIPAGFPYIAFSESGYYYSHISLYGFYQQVKFITLNYIESSVSKRLIEDGLNSKVLDNLFKIRKNHISRPIDYNLRIELEEIR